MSDGRCKICGKTWDIHPIQICIDTSLVAQQFDEIDDMKDEYDFSKAKVRRRGSITDDCPHQDYCKVGDEPCDFVNKCGLPRPEVIGLDDLEHFMNKVRRNPSESIYKRQLMTLMHAYIKYTKIRMEFNNE